MPDEQQPDSPADGKETVIDADAPTREVPADEPADAQPSGGPLFSAYGLVSTLLGLVSVAAVVFGLITWSMHRDDEQERKYRSGVLQTAASWTSVLINLNAENVDKGMQRLHDKTVGQLNSEFEATVQPYREVVQRIQSRSTGRIEAVAIASMRNDPESNADTDADGKSPAPGAGRTDPVVVIATSIAENVGGKPQTVHWALELDVTDVDGRMLISRLRSIR